MAIIKANEEEVKLLGSKLKQIKTSGVRRSLFLKAVEKCFYKLSYTPSSAVLNFDN